MPTKTKCWTVYFLLTCFIPFMLTGCLFSGGIVPAPELEDTQGTWIATEGNWAFFRLRLDNDGTGMFGETFHSGPSMIYRVTSWQLDEKAEAVKHEPEQRKKLVITLKPVGDARPLELTGWAGKTHLRLKLSWEDRQPRWATFYSENVMTGRAKQTRKAMEKITD